MLSDAQEPRKPRAETAKIPLLPALQLPHHVPIGLPLPENFPTNLTSHLSKQFMRRLWYLLRRQWPALSTENAPIAKDFRSALPRLWFAALCWPIVILLFYVYLCVA